MDSFLPKVILISLACCVVAAAQSKKPAAPPAVERTELKPALEALRDQLPEVAMAKLDRLLGAANLSPELSSRAKLLLTEAAVRARKWDRAITASQEAEIRLLPEAGFWRAMALQGSGKLSAAEKAFAGTPSDPAWPLAHEAAFNHAAVLAALGDHRRALQRIEPWRNDKSAETAARAGIWCVEFQLQAANIAQADSILTEVEKKGIPAALQPSAAYLRARLAHRGGQYEQAIKLFGAIAEQKSGLSWDLNHAAVLGMARSQIASQDRASALRTLSEFIQKQPDSPYLDAAFREFIAANDPPDPEMDKLLVAWAGGEASSLSAQANLALAAARKAAGAIPEALRIYAAFPQKHAGSPLAARAALLHARLLIESGDQRGALDVLTRLREMQPPPEVQSWVAGLQAKANYQLEEFKKAAALFTEAAGSATEEGRRAQLSFNAALASLEAGSPAEAVALLDTLPVANSRELQADLQLERGLYLASRGDADSSRLLRQFFDSHPGHRRLWEAAAAMVEIALFASPPNLDAARQMLESAAALAKEKGEKERVEVLRLYLEDAQRGVETFAAKADEFLKNHPDSVWRDQVLMKLGESYFNAQQFTRARASFEQLAEESPESPLVEPALFWAGKAALGSMAKDCDLDAIKLWDRAAKLNGPLRFKARIEQGKLDQRRDPDAAIQVFDAVLKSEPPPDAETRFTVLCLKGETLLARHANDEGKVAEASQCFDAVIQSATATAAWKQQAWVRKGAAFESLKNDVGALEAYHEAMKILQESRDPQERNYQWFFRAGEKAMRLLESKSDWKAAVAIADKLADAPGPQADAARERANRLRTQHFLFDAE